MPKSPLLLDRLFKTPHLEKIVPHLQPEVLHRVIQMCTLEDCADLIALATPAQISRVLDLDLWRVHDRGADERLDADRFGTWLEVLMESGAEVAAEKVMGLDLSLVTTGVAQHAAVFVGVAVSAFTTLDGELMPDRTLAGDLGCEIGGYRVQSRRSAASWHAIVELLAFLGAEHPEYFDRIMRGCVGLSNADREEDGFHALLQDREQDLFDRAAEREGRRETQGYVVPAQARAFLHEARHLRLDRDPPPASAIVQAYFRAIGITPRPEEDRTLVPQREDAVTEVEPAMLAEVLDVLRDAGVLTPPPRALLEGAEGQTSRLGAIHAYLESRAPAPEELAYLANTLLAGCVLQGRAFTPEEGFDAATAVCNLGLENWPRHWADVDLMTAFQVGWTVLHRNVCLFAAKRLIGVIADIHCIDRDVQLRLNGLRRDLIQHLAERAPWHARESLEVIVMLDAACWAALCGFIDECPVLHGAVGASRRHSHRIDAAQFEFISENSQIEAVHGFLDSLPSILTL